MESVRTSEPGGYEFAPDEGGLDGKVSVAAEAECNHAEQDERATERLAAVMPIKYTRSASGCIVRTLSEKYDLQLCDAGESLGEEDVWRQHGILTQECRFKVEVRSAIVCVWCSYERRKLEQLCYGTVRPHQESARSKSKSEGTGGTYIPMLTRLRLVRSQARKVRSEARWSRATLPSFCSSRLKAPWRRRSASRTGRTAADIVLMRRKLLQHCSRLVVV